MTKRRLKANVAVGGRIYGPDYPDNEVTDEVAALITRADLWDSKEDREVASPAPADVAASEPVVEVHPTGPPAEEAEPVKVNPTEGSEDDREPPPLGGRGSGRDAWAKYADALGVDVQAEAERHEIIESLKSAGKRVE